MIRFEIKNCNMILTEKQQKYQHYHPEKHARYEQLLVLEILPSNQRQIIEQVKFKFFYLGKALEIQTENQVDALKSLNLSNKTVELKQIEGKFPKNLLNDLIIYKLQNIIKLQEVIKSNELDYK